MTAERWREIHGTGAARDLSGGVRLRLTGPDAVRYLNGQVTNDVRKIPAGGALPACVTNHKGKLEAFVFLSQDADGALFISGDGDLRDFLPLRLEKYLIADNCALEDVTETTALVHLLGGAESTAGVSGDLAEGERAAACRRFGPPGVDVWTVPERVAFWLEKRGPLTAEEAETLEVLHAVPVWGRELTSDILPPEAGLDATAVDFHKGCYIGQEIISRLRSVGRVNRHLAALIQTSETGSPAQAGWSLFSRAEDGGLTAAGTVTSAADHPVTGARHLLGYVKRSASGPLLAGPAGGEAAVAVEILKDS
ncbi:MAG: hypothetical protein V4726_04955 [Verrucomicrobiota bacterium]